MDEKLNELKRLEVRAMDILGAAGKKELSHEEMQSWYEECIELEASSDTLLSNLSEEEAQEHGEYAEAVSNKITEARGLVISKLDSFHESHDTALDQRANMAMAGAVVESESKDDPKDETTRKTESPVIRDLTAALKEALESRDYYRGRLAETMEVLESDEDELKQRYLAAKKLGEELLSRLQQSESEMADLAHAHEALEERYQAAVALVAGVTERQDRARLMKKVREAIEMHPELQAFHKSLLACTTPDELEERLREYMEALDLPVQDKEEAMESQVTISAAKEETDGDVDEGTATDDEDDGEGPMGENSELPSAGESINESEDPEVLDGAPLLENHEDRGASVAHRAVKRMGLK